MRDIKDIEWITIAVLLGCYLSLWFATSLIWTFSPLLAVLTCGALVALHASLQHEAIHGHPTKWPVVNEALVFPALTLVIPYRRFRDTHIALHQDSILTDPFDDPESNFMDNADVGRLSGVCRAVLEFNNTLLGRILIGPLIAQLWFMKSDYQLIVQGDRKALLGWVWHIPAFLLVLFFFTLVPMPFWQFAIAAYIGNSIIKIRTFAEHRAHELARARTVIIEGDGLLSFLFLNNNLHAVHHCSPNTAWYQLPKLFNTNRAKYLEINEGYSFRSYWHLFRRYSVQQKDPLAHPIWQRH